MLTKNCTKKVVDSMSFFYQDLLRSSADDLLSNVMEADDVIAK